MVLDLLAEHMAKPHSSWNKPQKVSTLDNLKLHWQIAAILALWAASHVHNKTKDIIDKIFGRRKEDKEEHNHEAKDHTS